jgi:hypothetical protein
VVDVLDALFRQTSHGQLDPHAAFDAREHSRPTHPRIAARRELKVRALRCLRKSTFPSVQ